MSDTFSTLEELKEMAFSDSDARKRLTYLFDDGSFTELDAFAKADDALTGVITAFGYVDGNPVYAFSQDISVKNGAMTEAQAKKISKVYDLAAKTGVPVVAVYDSFGADVSAGQVADLARRFPMMAERQVVIVKEAQNIKNWDRLEAYFEKPQPTTVLVLAYKNGTIDGRKKVVAKAQKCGVVFESKKKRDYELPGLKARL